MIQDESLHEELGDWEVAEPLLPTMNELAPTAPDPLTLAEFYNPEMFVFQLVSIYGKLFVIHLSNDIDPSAYECPKISVSV